MIYQYMLCESCPNMSVDILVSLYTIFLWIDPCESFVILLGFNIMLLILSYLGGFLCVCQPVRGCYCFSCVQLFVTVWTADWQAPLSMGFHRQKYWNRLPCPPPDLSDSGIEPGSLMSPALACGFFTTITTSEAPCVSLPYSKLVKEGNKIILTLNGGCLLYCMV